jgi:hypothetical protein
MGMGINIETSNNLLFEGNNFFYFVKYGLNIMTSNNVTVNNNWIHGVYGRDITSKSLKDANGAVVACAHSEGDRCTNIVITNNVVSSVQSSGVDTFGYSTMAHDCGDYVNVVFKDNVAHSI